MIIEKITVYLNTMDLPEHYIKIKGPDNAEPTVMGPMASEIQDDVVRRLMETEIWKESHPESETHPDAEYIHEMGLTQYK